MINNFKVTRIAEELSQAKTRLIYGFLILIYIYILPELSSGEVTRTSQINLYIATLMVVFYAYGLMFFLSTNSRFNSLRQIFSITIDLSICAYTFFICGEWAALFLSLFLWIIIGNGIRFGINYLFYALFLAGSYFIIILLYTPYWQEHLQVGLGILFSILILPLFFAHLINRLHNIKNILNNELEKTKFIASHDLLTKLPNRISFKHKLEKELQRAKRLNGRFSVIFMDLNGFKRINDNYGHDVGDKVLIEVSNKLTQSIRETDLMARVGGDEFICVTAPEKSSHESVKLIERIKENISQPMIIDNLSLTIGISIGRAIYPVDGEDVEALLNISDQRMYADKAKNAALSPPID